MVETPHRPVMLAEVLEALQPERATFLVDLTFGAGGHSRALLEAASSDARLIAFDRDASALKLGAERLGPRRAQATLMHADYRRFGEALDAHGFGRLFGGRRCVDAILLDAGVSSMQLDDGARGFSFREEAPLDMRMDPESPTTAASLLDEWDEAALRDVLRTYGEVKRAGHFAREILKARRAGSLETTADLARLCEEKAGWQEAKKSIHPATLVFQALRIAVNDELRGLEQAVREIPRRLLPGGRAAVIAFHSLEDRIVKRGFRDATRSDIPRGVPVRGDDATEFSLVGGLQRPTDVEVLDNPRARSSRLRVIERRRSADAPSH